VPGARIHPWLAIDEFTIIANHMPTPADAWTFDPTVVTGAVEASAPVSFVLYQNYPNPFNPETHLRYSIRAAGKTNLKVHDLLGREVAVLVDELRSPGTYEVRFDGRGLSSGVYFYRLRSGSFVQTRKLMILR
jgi:hypothetical protein